MTMTCASCTNGGDIGPLYGMWMFDDITIDGTPVDKAELPQYSLSFQSNVVRLIRNYDHNEWISNMGFWAREDDDLTLDFSSQGDDWFYFKEIGFTPGVMHMRIESESNRSLRLQYVDAQGRTLRYILRKSL